MEREYDEALEKHQRFILEMQGVIFEKASAYTNLIIVAGYAGFFATWSNTSKLVSPCLLRTSAALMLISLVTFIVWEVAKMIIGSLSSRNLAEAALAPIEQFERKLEEISVIEQRRMARFQKTWPFVLFITVATGVVAAGIHIWALVYANFGL